MGKIEEIKECTKDYVVSDGVHPTCTSGIYMNTFHKILEELRYLVELGEMVAKLDHVTYTSDGKCEYRITPKSYAEFNELQGLISKIKQQETGNVQLH